MLGSRYDVKGGVSAMARTCRDEGLFERCGARYLATHRDGDALQKLAQAMGAWAQYLPALLAGRVRLVHAHLNSGASFWRKALFVWPALALGIPVVLQVHCGRFAAWAGQGSRLRRRVVRATLERAHCLALTEGAARELRSVAPGAAVDVLPNAVRIPPWRAPLDADRPRVLFLGVLRAEKGVEDLLRAWAEVARVVGGATLVLAGSGDIGAWRERARALGIGGRVEFAGWVADDARDALLARASLVVLPSHAEAMPMALLEAGAAGIPVVASRVGGVPDVVMDGVTGILVVPGDVQGLAGEIIALLRDVQRRRAMGAAARRHVAAGFAADALTARLAALWAVLSAPTTRSASRRHARGRPG